MYVCVQLSENPDNQLYQFIVCTTSYNIGNSVSDCFFVIDIKEMN